WLLLTRIFVQPLSEDFLVRIGPCLGCRSNTAVISRKLADLVDRDRVLSGGLLCILPGALDQQRPSFVAHRFTLRFAHRARAACLAISRRRSGVWVTIRRFAKIGRASCRESGSG